MEIDHTINLPSYPLTLTLFIFMLHILGKKWEHFKQMVLKPKLIDIKNLVGTRLEFEPQTDFHDTNWWVPIILENFAIWEDRDERHWGEGRGGGLKEVAIRIKQ